MAHKLLLVLLQWARTLSSATIRHQLHRHLISIHHFLCQIKCFRTILYCSLQLRSNSVIFRPQWPWSTASSHDITHYLHTNIPTCTYVCAVELNVTPHDQCHLISVTWPLIRGEARVTSSWTLAVTYHFSGVQCHWTDWTLSDQISNSKCSFSLYEGLYQGSLGQYVVSLTGVAQKS